MNLNFIVDLLTGQLADHSWSAFMLCISFGSGGSSGTSKNYPKWAEGFLKQFVPKGEQQLALFDPEGAGVRNLGGEALTQQLQGTTDPTLLANLDEQDAITAEQANEAFGKMSQRTLGEAEKYGAGGSSGAYASVMDQGRKLATDVAGITSGRRGQAYENVLQRQAAAVPMSSDWTSEALNNALAIGQFFTNVGKRVKQDEHKLNTGI